jgi:hypothetical protein
LLRKIEDFVPPDTAESTRIHRHWGQIWGQKTARRFVAVHLGLRPHSERVRKADNAQTQTRSPLHIDQPTSEIRWDRHGPFQHDSRPLAHFVQQGSRQGLSRTHRRNGSGVFEIAVRCSLASAAHLHMLAEYQVASTDPGRAAWSASTRRCSVASHALPRTAVASLLEQGGKCLTMAAGSRRSAHVASQAKLGACRGCPPSSPNRCSRA